MNCIKLECCGGEVCDFYAVTSNCISYVGCWARVKQAAKFVVNLNPGQSSKLSKTSLSNRIWNSRIGSEDIIEPLPWLRPKHKTSRKHQRPQPAKKGRSGAVASSFWARDDPLFSKAVFRNLILGVICLNFKVFKGFFKINFKLFKNKFQI